MKKKLSIVLILVIIMQLMFMNGYSIADNIIVGESSQKGDNISTGNSSSISSSEGNNISTGETGEIIGVEIHPGDTTGTEIEIIHPGDTSIDWGTVLCSTLGHDFSNQKIKKLPTCTEEGEYICWCTRCGAEDASRILVIEPLGHTRGEGTVTKEATCEETGIKTYMCLVCSEVAGTTTIEKLGHEYNNGVCIRCKNELPKIESTNYIIEDNYIIGIKPGTTIEEIKKNITSNVNYKIIKPDGTEMKSDENVGTGCKVEFETVGSYTIIVTGDVDGDGEINLVDLAKIKKHLVQITQLAGEYNKAADINKDGEVNLIDMAQMKKAIVGLIQL